jgi:N6-adenosine-specific RNA methylase IME4
MMLTAHPFADLFPMLDRADASDLRADIAAHGLRDRVVLFDGKILDGRNRYGALVDIAKLGLAYRGGVLTAADIVPMSEADLEWGDFFEVFDGTEAEALEYVLSKNLHRRHLNESQRAMVAANLATLGQGRPTTEKTRQLADLSQEEAAERLHVSERSIQRAAVVREHGVGELNEAVQRGDLAVSAAAQLARLPADEQARLIREAADPKALAKVARDLRAEKQAAKAEKREARERDLGARIAALPDRRYGVILADPEWKYEVWSDATGRDRSPDNHYPTSELEAIKARPVGDIAAADSVLFLWVTIPFLDAGRSVLAAWGFDYVTHLIWIKERPGEAHGTGYWFWGEHEVVLVGKRGSPPAPTPGTQFPSYFVAAVGEHSEKPGNVHDIAESYFPSLPKIELNARARRPGWDAWGLEAPEVAPESVALPEPVAELVAALEPPAEQAREMVRPAPATLPLPDTAAIGLIGEAVAAAIGNGASLRSGDSRLHTAEERLIRRHVIRIAFDGFGLSFPRLAAVLGGSKQAAAQLRATAAGEVAADTALAAKLAGVVAAVAGRAWR